MGRLNLNLYSATLIALMLSVGACIPKQNSSAGSSKSSDSESDALAITTVRAGPGSAYNAEIYQGNYYSKYDPVVINGSCKGNVQKIQVQDTPLSGSTTSQTVSCSNGTFSWTKSYSTQTEYSLVLTAQDSSGTAISGITPISKNYTYDSTNPTAAVFVSPSITNSYTITDGTTSVTIAGQVLNEVVKLIGPYSLNIPLFADGDGIHKNFAFNATVPVSSSANFVFTGYDAAANSSSNTMSIDSVLSLSIPVAAQEIGGSHQAVGNLRIESTVGFMSEVIVNSNVKHTTGSAGMMGNL